MSGNLPYEAAGGALFNATMQPIGASPWPTFDMMVKARPFCRVLTPLDTAHDIEPACVDLIYGLPAGGPAPIPDDVMSHLVAIADSGGRIALHATNDDAITDAVGRILALSGGGHG